MAITAILQSVDGKKHAEVLDQDYLLAKVWPVGDKSFALLQYIDPYGNAIFNGAQMSEVQKELQVLLEKAPMDDQKRILRRVGALAETCRQHPHFFLRFRGD